MVVVIDDPEVAAAVVEVAGALAGDAWGPLDEDVPVTVGGVGELELLGGGPVEPGVGAGAALLPVTARAI